MSYVPTIDETREEITFDNWEKSDYFKVPRSSGYHSKGYDLPFIKTGSYEIHPETTHFPKVEEKYRDSAERIRKKEAIGRLQRKAVELSRQLEKTYDIFDTANISLEIKSILKDMWQLRNEREHNWGDLINILQAVFAKTDVELLNNQQKKSLRKVINDYLCNSHVDDADLERSIITLSENGLDPWVGISGISERNDFSFLEGMAHEG
ncbi:MAG: hypothetical protein JXC36_05990 [Candidatus Atribacteria bacterium]|nr:hypothetical protein [Candidatus Atribacteria bacterium]